ncbi:SDR family NAD(P)-dependent oxidoreductase [Amycolatopsis sp. cg5]|uniref:SDR family NAD(P)-dependent oxidoreductase n=1 Tax=Amycolatopsis sp. cg5 TaxID=3238802 RepID=UPI0035260555
MNTPCTPTQPPIAVVGIGAHAPGAPDAAEFWRVVLDARDMIRDVPPTHWLPQDYYDPDPGAEDHTYCHRGAFLDPVDFDSFAHGIPPATLAATDTTQLLALRVAEQVLADCGVLNDGAVDRERVSVILGTAALELLHTMSNRMQRPVWLRALRESGIAEPQALQVCDRIAGSYPAWQEATFPGLLSNVVSGRIANRFDLHGTNYTTDAACASSLAAVSGAINELALGNADLVITGGVDTLNDIVMYMCFSKTPALSKSGDCRPFSDAADGTMLGEALVMVALKRLADAERDGDHVYAVIRGVGSSSDGRGSAIYAPAAPGQARALRRAYAAAGYGPETVELIEAHGTATAAGDVAEFTALREVFDESGREDRQWCALGSVKSQIGHTKSAAGAAGLLKAVLALQHKTLPPTIKVDRPNSALELENSPFYLNTRPRPWVRPAGHPRRASVSSFGFGGTNFHITLEEYVPATDATAKAAPRMEAAPTQLVLLSGDSGADVIEQAGALVSAVIEDGRSLPDVARQSQRSYDYAAAARMCLVVSDGADLEEQVSKVTGVVRAGSDAPVSTPAGLCFDRTPAEPGRVALLFSGQGSQYVGMGADLAMHYPVAMAAWDRAADLSVGDRPLHQVVSPRPAFTEEERLRQQTLLTQTEWAQPALAVQSVTQLSVLRALGVKVDCVAGHSFGELVALHAAGVIDEPTLLRLARARGTVMADAADGPGAMLAAELDRDEARRIAGQLAGEVWLANINSPKQVVFSGQVEAIARLSDRLAADGVTARRLQASAAFHTPMLSAARERFTEETERGEFRSPAIEVYGNADADPYPVEPALIRRRLADHLLAPVRFADQIQAMHKAGVRTFIEVGANEVLSKLVRETLDGEHHLAVSLDRKGVHGVTALQRALGRLAVAGVVLDLEASQEARTTRTTTNGAESDRKSAATVRICGTNFGKPDVPAVSAQSVPVDGAAPPALPDPPAQALTPAALPGPADPSVEPLAPAAPSGAVASAFEQAQRQAAEAHAEYQRLTADAHFAYLRVAETALRALVGTSAEEAGPEWGPVLGSSEIDDRALIAPPSTEKPADPIEDSGSSGDVGEVLLDVLTEKTGYPREVLEPHLELEADLGIDSIKRVEILSLLRKRFPAAVELDAAEVARLRTLGEVVARYRGASVDTGPSALVEVPTSDSGSSGDVGEVLLDVLTEKTGYPREVLEPHLELEADLGIDSIKRVEILSLLRKRFPAAVGLDAAEVARLRTLGEVIARYRGVSASADSPAPGVDVAYPVSDLSRAVTVMRPAPAPGLELPGMRLGVVTVVDGGAGLASLVAAKLQERGVKAEANVCAGPETAVLISLHGLRPVTSATDAIAVNREVFTAAREIAESFAGLGGTFVVVQDTGGDFGLSGAGDRAWLGGLAGLARSVVKEWPRSVVKVVDCERGGQSAEELASTLVAELFGGGATTNVGLRADGAREALFDELLPADVTLKSPVHRGSVIVATGGARGVTAAALLALAEEHQPTLVLLGRSELGEEPPVLAGITGKRELRQRIAALPSRTGRPWLSVAEIEAETTRVLAAREIRATLSAAAAAGAVVRYLAVDVRDAGAVREALDRVRSEFGPVTGLVHGAGVLADARLADKPDAQYEAVFGTKVASLEVLLAATAADPLDLFVVFSSVAGRFGNPGQTDYAMANEVLAQVASEVAARRPGCVVRSIAWGPWDGGMVGPELRERFLGNGVPLIPQAAGAAAFVSELTLGSAPTRVTVAAGAQPEPFGGETEPTPVGAVVVHRDTHPYLADHAIAGTPVLPMALVLDWFTGVASALSPGRETLVLWDFEVVNGVRLPEFAATGHQLTITAARTDVLGSPRWRLVLADVDGRVRYRATAGEGSEAHPRAWGPAEERSGFAIAGRHYGGPVLFHGPAFHALGEPEWVSESGAATPLVGIRELPGWPRDGWHMDPGAVDACLQLALLWAASACGAVCLPTKVDEVRVLHRGPVEAPARGVLVAVERDPVQPVCDVALVAGDGAVLTELLGVTMIRRPENRD